MTKKRTGVPPMRGVSAFLTTPVESTNESTVLPSSTTAIANIHLPAKQPRRFFDSQKLDDLAASIRQHGILEPILVRPLSTGQYELVAGERRYRAAEIAGLSEVPIVIRELSDAEALQLALIENLQREDLNPVEETEGILQLLAIALNTNSDGVISLLHQSYNAKQRGKELNGNVTIQLKTIEEVLSVVGRFNTESFRSNRLPLLKLPSDVLDILRQGKLEYTKARAIARLKDDQARHTLLQDAIAQNLSLAQIKERLKDLTATAETETTVSDRLVAVSRKVKQKLDNPKKQRRLEKLLQELELLVAE